jgi:uncharacterized hydrophobic protein (TIGR00271 family)
VIIGAMLVAPLFTPILALSLAIVQGDIRLLRVAVEASIKGIALAVGVAWALAALSPLRPIGGEILGRVEPNLFDLAVALASGAAGAYAIARKDVAAALPGVAIAAALVPPLSVVGIGLAVFDPRIAGGSSLLFLTNLVAIVLAGAVTLLLLGFRPTERGERTERLRLGLVASLVLLVVITIPLALVFVGSVRESSTRRTITEVLAGQVRAQEGLELLDFEFQPRDGAIEITARLYAQAEISDSTAIAWREELAGALDRQVDLVLITVPMTLRRVEPPK